MPLRARRVRLENESEIMVSRGARFASSLAPGVALAAVLSGIGCGREGARSAPSSPLVAVSYNLANLTGAQREPLVAQLRELSPDFAALQECADCGELVSALGERYRMAANASHGVAILYDESRWGLGATGELELGENDDGWGRRIARWARFADLESGASLYVYSTHWCVPIRSPDDRCDEARQLEYADTIIRDIFEHDKTPAVFAGDLNVFEDFERGEVVRSLIDAGLVDVFREAKPEADGTTFFGEGAPSGRLDYIFATPAVEVSSAFIDRDAVPEGEGSDHHAVVGEVAFGAE